MKTRPAEVLYRKDRQQRLGKKRSRDASAFAVLSWAQRHGRESECGLSMTADEDKRG